jgi:hypothetical protein
VKFFAMSRNGLDVLNNITLFDSDAFPHRIRPPHVVPPKGMDDTRRSAYRGRPDHPDGRAFLASLVAKIEEEIIRLNKAVAAMKSVREQAAVIVDTPTPVHSVPAATLSCLQALCDATAMPLIADQLAMPGERIASKDHKREAHDASILARSESGLSTAETVITNCVQGESRRAGEDHERKASMWSEEWPNHRAVCGKLTLRASAGHKGALRAICSIEHRMLTLRIAQLPHRDKCALDESSTDMLVEIPVEHLAVGLQRGRPDMFMIATLLEGKIQDDICCFAEDPNEWVAVFRRMGVPIFNVSEGIENGVENAQEPWFEF